MYSWEELRNRVNDSISNLKYAREPLALYEPITYTIAQGGKRVRPVALLMAYNLYKEDVEKALGVNIDTVASDGLDLVNKIIG